MTRRYPEEPAGGFPAPPRTLTDDEGRAVTVREGGEADTNKLVEMYEAFDAADRAQGIPPVDAVGIRDWLEELMSRESVNVVVEHDGDIVGHATLVPDREDAYELAIFVLREFQGAGIGTTLLEGLLGHAEERGIEKVWLTVERWNKAAVGLYRKLGFEPSGGESFEMEMGIRLHPADDSE
jgi:ribosomal protein S18 acetylase RimI-like enzyme